ncbi:hypothetical protein AB0C13_27740 [Streptomyces sp. NPDC049099]|uniref:hypothetical protein n=1 Tax=Streptomyces sp. NPDC049099 TaxID=3155768 RepID=UPI0034169E81
MKRLIRKAGAAGAVTTVVAGALLATGGSAAATPGPAGHAAGTAAVHADRRTPCRSGPGQRIDPWVAGQVAWSVPGARHRLAVYDPWIKDQLARFASFSC